VIAPGHDPRPRGNGRLRHRHLPFLAVWCVGGLLAVCGCAAAHEMNAIKAHVRRMTQDIGALQVRLHGSIKTGGGDVNEPVTGWILAIGYAAVPISFLLYMLAHRSARFRHFKERLRGGPRTRL